MFKSIACFTLRSNQIIKSATMTFRSYLSTLFFVLLLLVSACSKSEPQTTEPTDGWITLFDGESFDGWKQYNADEIGPKWIIEDGLLIVSKDGDAIDKNTGFGASLITIEEFDDFEFELEYKMSPGGNSGIMFNVQEDSAFGTDFLTGPEFQLLDDVDSPSESMPNRMTASLYDMFPASEKTLHPADEWNKVKLVIKGNDVEHWLNGEKVLEYTIASEAWNKAKAESKWRNNADWGSFDKGHISLQDHGDIVAFRNIRVRKL